MNKTVTLASYRARVLRVVDHLWLNLDQGTDLNTLAEVAHFSPYHFHRIYREIMHENLYQTVRRLRLHRAASLLIRTDLSVQDVARQVGYGGAESFTRAFSSSYGGPPAQFRQKNQAHSEHPVTLPPQNKVYPMNYSFDIVDIPDMSLGGLPHQGDFMAIGATFEQLFATLGSSGLVGPDTRYFGIYYNDPCATPIDQLRSMACATLTPEQAAQAGLQVASIGGGPHAVVTHIGPYAELEKGYDWFYGQLPELGYEMADQPPFEEYVNDPKDTPPAQLITKIHLPLANL